MPEEHRTATTTQRGPVREIAWRELFPWLSIAGTVRMGLQVRVLVPAAAAVLLTVFGWWLLGKVFAAGIGEPWREAYSTCPWEANASGTSVRFVPPVVPEHRGILVSDPHLGLFPAQPFLDAWLQLSAPFRQIFRNDLSLSKFTFLLLCGLWAAAVWGLFGGIVTRLAAMQLARQEKITWGDAFAHARSKWPAYFSAPLMPLLGVLGITIPMAIMGLLMRFEVGWFIVSLLWPLMLVGSLLMVIFLIGLLFGWPLMFPTISAEGTDSFDALSRSYSYVYQRPWHYLFYAIVAAILGAFGALFVGSAAGAVVYLAHWAVGWGSGVGYMPEGVGIWGANVIGFWNGVVWLVALGWAYGYFWCASTAIYFQLRYQVDGTETDEVYVDEQQEAFTLPTLATDAAGVPIAPTTNGSPAEDATKPPSETTPPQGA